MSSMSDRVQCTLQTQHTLDDATQRRDAPSLKDPSASAMDVAVSAALERVMRRVMPRFEEFAEETTRCDQEFGSTHRNATH